MSPKRFEEADEQLTKANEYGSHRLTVLQIQRCPWCGTPITAAQVKADATMRRVFVYCGDELARCPFAKGGQVAEGLPVLTVDEEIYRLTPAFVIATVDKFARLAREGEAAALFGYVSRRCGRHGYVHADYAAVPGRLAHPAQRTGTRPRPCSPVGRLRPPDLIIQDELHLITGALGTAVGLFEVAVETLSSWETPDGKPVQAADRRVDSNRAQRPGTGAWPVRTTGGDLPAAGARRGRHVLLPGGADRPTTTPGGATSGSAPRASACRAPRSGSRRCCCPLGSCCSTAPVPPPTRT